MRYTALGETERGATVYWKDAECTNCGLNKSLAFTVGGLIQDHHCPVCGCKTLHTKQGSEK